MVGIRLFLQIWWQGIRRMKRWEQQPHDAPLLAAHSARGLGSATSGFLAHPWLVPSLAGAALALLVLFHAINNWLWLAANVTLLGWDVPGHLGTSIIYNSILQPLTPKALFEAVVWHPNRPPLVFLSAVPLYRLFGVSVDVGTMTNVFFLAMLFASVYGIGLRLGGRGVGLLAAFVVSTFPGIFATSRFFYHELALAAAVSLGIFLLLASEGFEQRAFSLLFGLSFGLGLLTTRTYLTFIFAPLGFVILRSAALPDLVRRLRGGFRLDLRDLLLALGVGSALAAIWYLPGREIAASLPLGVWLLPLWAALVTVTVYLLRRSAGPGTNLLSALALGGTLASVWYLPRVTFVRNLLSFGFGVNDPRERSAGLDRLETYVYFAVRLVNEHLSLVTCFFLLGAGLGIFLYLRRKRPWWPALRQANPAWWVTVLWVVGPYLVMTLSIYRKSRGIIPLLPALALLLAGGLLKLPRRRVATVLVLILIGWGLLQFVVLSYPGPHWLAEQTRFRAPILGETGLFAQGGTVQLPASGETDPAYWVGPDLLGRVEAGRQTSGAETVSLGVLVNNAYLNPIILDLLAMQDYPGVQLHNLAGLDGAQSAYPMLFDQDYIVCDGAERSGLGVGAIAALDHLEASPGFFDATFVLDQEMALPDGHTVQLYRKLQQLAPGVDLSDYAAAAEQIGTRSQPDDAILLVPPQQAVALGQTYDGGLQPYLLPQAQPLDTDDTALALSEIVAAHPVLWVLFRAEEAADPDRFIEGWLNANAYRSQSEWFGNLRLVVYGTPTTEPEDRPQHSLNVRLGESIRLLGYSLAQDTVEPARMICLTLYWQADRGPTQEPLAVFAHLVDEEGGVIAQQDSQPVGGSRPTTGWAAGEVIRDPIGILLPVGADLGNSRLAVGLYRPDTGERLLATDLGQGEPGSPIGDQVYLSIEGLWGKQP